MQALVRERVADGALTITRYPPIAATHRRGRASRHARKTESSASITGMYKIWFARNYRTHVSNTVLVDNALATMGAGLPSGMMAAMPIPDRLLSWRSAETADS